MKKGVFLLLFALMAVILVACAGDNYDNAIDEVISHESKVLSDTGIRKGLERKDCNIEVYNEGEYIKISYLSSNAKKRKSYLYQRNDDDGYSAKQDTYYVDGLKADYVENNI
ncbi:cystatin-like fold lipoprotein [Listeria booriae]|uniref:Cystatin-like fold lipoprotein n=1 Tax=Listeria booriae TaxID=1552123 RepID=A0A841ZWS3_9LIST|nr:cystatin-like fold lipoprotein [Listeria booriae]MBC1565046.1 cystatin-like fold lipoprotein [Listeria booriae]